MIGKHTNTYVITSYSIHYTKLYDKGGKEGKGCLGYSTGELEGMQIAGNTFDYPFIHGKAIQAAGSFSFVSCSDESVESGEVV